MAKRKCRHVGSTVITWKPGSDEVFSMRCSPTIGCGSQLSLGPSNDEPVEVRVEIRAADLSVAGPTIFAASFYSLFGFENHRQCREKCAEQLKGDHASIAWWAGWLLREILTHDNRADRDRDAWSWSVERPIAEQWPALATVLGAKDPNEDVLRDPDITERNARVIAERNAATDADAPVEPAADALSAALADANAVLARTEAAVKEMAVAFAAMADDAEHETTDKRFDDSEEG